MIIIAGASSGIGKALAIELAPQGEPLYLIGQNQERLEATLDLVEKAGGVASVNACDLTDFDRTEQLIKELLESKPPVSALYYCVARNVFGEVAHLSLDDLEWVYRNNLLTTAQWLTSFYPEMVRRGAGTIVFLSSASAFTGLPFAAPYVGTKAAFDGLEKSLLPEARHTKVKLHFVYAGFVSTRFFEASRFRNCHFSGVMKAINGLGFPMISAEKAAKKILKGVKNGRSRIVFPAYAQLTAFLSPRVPWIAGHIHRRWLRMIKTNHENPEQKPST